MCIRDRLGQVGLRVADRDAVDRDGALLERLERVDALDQGRLAAARGATDHHDFALGDFGGAVDQDLEAAVPLADVLERDHRMMAILSCRRFTSRESCLLYT